MNKLGKIFLIPNTLGETPWQDVLPSRVRELISSTNYFIVENEKSARYFIKHICPEKSQPALRLYLLNKHTPKAELSEMLLPCLQGENMGIISEAGCPAIADPGADVVQIAHIKGIEVEPLVGPSSIILSVMASGLSGQNFAFNGYLPIEKSERKLVLKKLEKRAREEQQAQVFIETPYRNDKLMEEMLHTLHPSTQLCVASNLTLSTQFLKTKSIAQWKNEKIMLHKQPTIFVIG